MGEDKNGGNGGNGGYELRKNISIEGIKIKCLIKSITSPTPYKGGRLRVEITFNKPVCRYEVLGHCEWFNLGPLINYMVDNPTRDHTLRPLDHCGGTDGSCHHWEVIVMVEGVTMEGQQAPAIQEVSSSWVPCP